MINTYIKRLESVRQPRDCTLCAGFTQADKERLDNLAAKFETRRSELIYRCVMMVINDIEEAQKRDTDSLNQALESAKSTESTSHVE